MQRARHCSTKPNLPRPALLQADSTLADNSSPAGVFISRRERMPGGLTADGMRQAARADIITNRLISGATGVTAIQATLAEMAPHLRRFVACSSIDQTIAGIYYA